MTYCDGCGVGDEFINGGLLVRRGVVGSGNTLETINIKWDLK